MLAPGSGFDTFQTLLQLKDPASGMRVVRIVYERGACCSSRTLVEKRVDIVYKKGGLLQLKELT